MKFTDVLTEKKKKKRKHLRGSDSGQTAKEKKRVKENGRQMERQVQVYENFKLGDSYLLIKFK